jgi:ornithine cyclodeaminase/alanine dehydrogenase-like protein (mu-crystallin family)
MGAALPSLDLLGFRSYLYNSARTDRGEQVVALYRYSTMELKALFLGQLVGSLRTGASVVAALKIAQPGLRTLGIIGTGNQARQVLACASSVFPLESVWAWSPNAKRRAEFREWARAELHHNVNLADDVRHVLREAPAIALVTSSEETVVTSEMMPGPRLLVSISAYRRPEIDLRLLDSARHIWTDSVDQAGNRGTLFQDSPRREKLRPLLQGGDGEALRDGGSTRIIINTGAAWEEVLLAESLLRAAERARAGLSVDLGNGHDDPEPV